MNKNTPISIRSVNNGFIVEPVIYRTGEAIAESDIKVFSSMVSMNRFLEDHYEYRSKCLESDS